MRGEAVRTIVEFLEDIARREGERQARLESTREATSARKKKTADRVDNRRKTIRGICDEKRWDRETPGLLKKLLHELDERDLPGAKNTIDADLKVIFPNNDVVGNPIH
jgi:hypothetical protein